MIGTLVGAVLGFFAAVLPAVFNALAEYFDHRKDLDKTQVQIRAAQAGVLVDGPFFTASAPESFVPLAADDSPLPTTPTPTAAPSLRLKTKVFPQSQPYDPEGHDPDDESELEAGEVRPLAVRIFATLRAGVRPLITYGFFALFAFIKLKGMFQGFYVDHTPALLLLPVLWDEGTQSLFAAVLAFWFGSRAIEKQQAAKAMSENP